MELWIGLLILCAAVAHASWNAVVKNAVDSLVMQALVIGVSAVIALPFAVVLPFPGAQTWGYILAGVLVHGFYFAFLVKAYEIGDFGHVYPVARGTGPMIVAVFAAVFLGEALTVAQYTGVALVSLGILSLALTAPGAGGTRALRYALTVGLIPSSMAWAHAAAGTLRLHCLVADTVGPADWRSGPVATRRRRGAGNRAPAIAGGPRRRHRRRSRIRHRIMGL